MVSTPPRFLIHCVGSGGDVLPFIAIATALQARGAEVTLATSVWFEAEVRAAGVPMLPLGTREDYLAALADPMLWHPLHGVRVLWSHVLGHLRGSLDALEPHLRDPDTMLVGSTLALAVRVAAERGHARTVTVHLSPACLPSASDWPGGPGLDALAWLPLPLRRLALRGMDAAADRIVAPPWNELRHTLGLPPVRRVLSQWLHSPCAVIAAFPAWFAAAQPDWPSQAQQAAFPRRFAVATDVLDPARDPALDPALCYALDPALGHALDPALDPALDLFLRAGSPPVVITAGTGMTHARAFFTRALEATAQAGCRALVLTAFPEQLPQPLSADVKWFRHAPFDRLLPRAASIMHHGGIGTLASAFAAGIPQLIAPNAVDQFDNAKRAQRLGVARRLPARRRANWADDVRWACKDQQACKRAEALAVQMAADGDGAGQIAEVLLQMAAAPPDVAPQFMPGRSANPATHA